MWIFQFKTHFSEVFNKFSKFKQAFWQYIRFFNNIFKFSSSKREILSHSPYQRKLSSSTFSFALQKAKKYAKQDFFSLNKSRWWKKFKQKKEENDEERKKLNHTTLHK